MPTLIRGIFSGGGGKIKDATALPSDVAKGKVFYNNDGRQEGNKDFSKYLEEKILSVNIDKSMLQNDTHGGSYQKLTFYPDSHPVLESTSLGVRYRKQITLQFKTILAIEVNGKRYDISHSTHSKLDYFVFIEPTNKPNAFYGNFMVAFDKNKNVFLGMDSMSTHNSINFMIHYI